MIALRPLTEADLPAVTRIHRGAFPASALTRLGAEAVCRYYQPLVGAGEATYQTAALWDGDMIGFCFDGDYRGVLRAYLRRNRAWLAWQTLTHVHWLVTAPQVRHRAGEALRLLAGGHLRPPTVPPDILPRDQRHGILAIAVLPQMQGRGAGAALLQAAEDHARQRRRRQLLLTVGVENDAALTFYLKRGFRKTPDGGGWRGILVKPL